MKYTTEVTINLPREQVIAIFDDPEKLKKWQPTLVKYEHLSGDVGQPGSQTLLAYDTNGRKMQITETVVSRNLPDELTFTFDASGVHNVVRNRFIALDASTTKWIMENDFQFSGFMVIMSLFLGRAFRNQTKSDMERFKEFAEGIA